MKDNNVISVSTMDEIMKDYFPVEETVDFHGQELTIRKLMPFTVAAEIVKKVSDGCFGDDWSFHPEVFDFGIRLCYVDACTNIRLPENIEKQYEMLYLTDLWDIIYSSINHAQYDDICRSATAIIRTRNEANRVLFERDVQNVTEQMENIGQQLSELFGSITADDIKNLVHAISENGLDEEKIVATVVQEQNKARDNVVRFTDTEDTGVKEDGE